MYSVGADNNQHKGVIIIMLRLIYEIFRYIRRKPCPVKIEIK